ncbi:hypothetical protein [Amycolatopsis tolypomycina]|uniref:hypothetical protein n=1 Tax=Amycolatopsis tolypomycina TaxID=208445 RepID=UPI00115F991A|nr:hypothetical protein [Amycolatopsis tolypomycina]
MAKDSKLAKQLRALKDLSGLNNKEIAERSEDFVNAGSPRPHPISDRSIGDWLRGEHRPSEDGLKALVGILQRAAAEHRPLIAPADPELTKDVAEGRWLAWRAEAQEGDGRRPARTDEGSRWEEVLRTAKIWPDSEEAAELREQALVTLRQLEGERRRAVEAELADDPWLDEGLPERTVRRADELVGYLAGAHGRAVALPHPVGADRRGSVSACRPDPARTRPRP